MIWRVTSLSGVGMIAGLLCGLPTALQRWQAVCGRGEPVRWITLPWDLDGSFPIAVAAHLAGPLAVGIALGLLAGLIGLLPATARLPRWFRRIGLMMLGAAPLLLLLGLALAHSAGASLVAAPPGLGSRDDGQPNLLLIYIDTLRQDHLSCYGRARCSTPFLDRLAASSVQFQSATSPASHTVPAVTSVMTCRYPGTRGLGRGEPFRIPDQSATLARRLQSAGYRTAAFIGNYVLGREYNTGVWQGFEIYDDRFPQQEKERLIPEREGGALARSAMGWLRAHHDQRFFLWLHFQDPHGPYIPPAGALPCPTVDGYGPARRAPLASNNSSRGGIPSYQLLAGGDDPRHYLAAYDGEVAHVDLQVGLVLARLRTLDLHRNTVVVVLSDHGEAMEDDHGWYFSHGHDLTEDQVRVPLMIRLPDGFGGRVDHREVSTLDLYPTLLGLAGAAVPPGVSGRDLLSPEGAAQEDEVVLTFTGGGVRAVRSGPWKLILRGPRQFLYNTDLDPGETVNLAETERGQLLWMIREMNERMAANRKARQGGGVPVEGWSDDVRQRLKQLGYVD